MTALRTRIAQRRHRRATRCRIQEEWDGHYIGRRHCSRHETIWDTGGPCPSATPST